MAVILKVVFLNSSYRILASVLTVKLLCGECHRTSLMSSSSWFRYWFGAIRQQAIAWASVYQDPCRHMALLGHIELTVYHTQYSSIEILHILYLHVSYVLFVIHVIGKNFCQETWLPFLAFFFSNLLNIRYGIQQVTNMMCFVKQPVNEYPSYSCVTCI